MSRRLLLAFGFIAAASLTFAADKETEELLGKMRAAYKAVKTAKLTLKATFKSGPMGDVEGAATVLFAAGNKVHAVVKGLLSEDVVVVSDGKEVTIEGLPDGRRKDDFSMDLLQGVIPGNLELLCFWDYERQLSTGPDGNMRTSTLKIASEKWNDKEWTVLEEEASEQQVFVRYFIDPKTHLIWRTVVFQSGSKNELLDAQITELELDAKLDDEKFKIK